jgi:tetratricopeptide (TPR) repeat protein
MGKGQYDKAISDFNKAIDLNPKFAEAYNNRGLTYAKKGQYDKAISDFTKTIEINPSYTLAYQNRGIIYMIKLGDKNKACSDFKRACELGLCKVYGKAKRKNDCN